MNSNEPTNLLNKDFHQLTVLNNKVVCIEEVEIEFPLDKRTINPNKEYIVFKTSCREFIHLTIYQNSIRQNMNFNEWEENLFRLIIKDSSLSDIKKASHQSWMLHSATLLFSKWKACDEVTTKKFLFNCKEGLFDILDGKKDSELKRYREIIQLRKYHNQLQTH